MSARPAASESKPAEELRFMRQEPLCHTFTTQIREAVVKRASGRFVLYLSAVRFSSLLATGLVISSRWPPASSPVPTSATYTSGHRIQPSAHLLTPPLCAMANMAPQASLLLSPCRRSRLLGAHLPAQSCFLHYSSSNPLAAANRRPVVVVLLRIDCRSHMTSHIQLDYS